jgi:hypothetical protein
MDDFLRKSIKDAEKLRLQLPSLRENTTVQGMVKYNEVLLEAIERQHNIYTRLRLMGDKESVETADEMEYVALTYLGRPEDSSMSEFFTLMKNEVIDQLGMLSLIDYNFEDGSLDGDDWSWE